MNKKDKTFETAGTYQLFHGGMNQFEQFTLDNLGANGTAQEFGIYLTPNKSMASMYANRSNEYGYLYTVDVDLKKPASLEERTITEEELSEIIDRLQVSHDILNDFNDVEYYGEKVVKREVLAILNENDNDVDLMNEISNNIGDKKLTAEVFYEVGGYTHTIAENQLRQQDNVIVVFDPERIKIQNVQNLELERSVPAMDSDPFDDNDEEFEEQLVTVREFWKEAISKDKPFEIYGYSVNDGEGLNSGVRQLYTPSTREEYEYQLTTFDSQGEPISHFDITKNEIEKTLEDKSSELLSRLPYSSESTEYVIKFYEDIEDKEIEKEIKKIVLEDVGMNLEYNHQYYNIENWQDSIEAMKASNIEPARLSLDNDVLEFYESHKQEIEKSVDSLATLFNTDKQSALGLDENSSDMDYKRLSSRLAYNVAVAEISKEIDNGKFEIPALSENRVLEISSYNFEME